MKDANWGEFGGNEAIDMMEHKAFVFDYEAFRVEFLPLLERGLETGDCDGLKRYVQENLAFLTDPYEGERLAESWEEMIEVRDAHQYGDFALTKFYSPERDIGLGGEWERIQRLVPVIDLADGSPLLGIPVGPESNRFDPGKMGSYFQSAELVRRNLDRVERVNQELGGAIGALMELLKEARQVGMGLYVTF